MAEQTRYDLVVIGAGPGGYVAAARAGRLGMKVACVDREARLGGVCLRIGCIPSKALLDSSEYYALSRTAFAEHGIKAENIKIDLKKMMARKEDVVQVLTDNVRKLLEGNKVTIIRGTARLIEANRVEVTSTEGSGGKGKKQEIAADHILLATGSEPVELNGLAFDGKHIVTSTEALAFTEVPRHLVVVGGGYIGLELGSVWSRLGSRVTVLEMTDRIAGVTDGQISRTLMRVLKKQGLDIQVSTKVLKADVQKGKISVSVSRKDGSEETIVCDRLLAAVGRRPVTRGLGLENAGIEPDAVGAIPVDAAYRTSAPSVYAIGDVIAGPMLAHKASAEGIAAVENMAGKAGEVNYDAIPAVIYTFPEVAAVGMTEEQLKERGIPYCKGSYPFSGAGRARCIGETEGLVKVLSHERTDRILGVHIIGARASDMIAEATLAIEMNASAEDLGRTIHGHPTFAEALQEAANVARECSIYAG